MTSELKKNFSLLFQKIIRFFAPPKCLECSVYVSDYFLVCSDCFKKYDQISNPFCFVCGTPLELQTDVDKQECLSCIAKKPSYDISRSIFVFNENIKRLLFLFKYHDNTNISIYFANLLYIKYKDISDHIDIVIPSPMHKIRRIIRKYNQAQVLAEAYGKISKKPVSNNILLKSKNTKKQTFLTKKQREKNLINSFYIKNNKDILGKNILLIDDVITTGSTVNECAKILKNNGASKVYVFSVCRTVNNKFFESFENMHII